MNKTVLGQVGGVTKKLFKKGFNFIKKAYKNLHGNNKPSMAIEIIQNFINNKDGDNFDSKRINEDIYVPNESSKKNVILIYLNMIIKLILGKITNLMMFNYHL